MKSKVLYPELSYQITGLCFKVQRELGRFCRERQFADKLEELLKTSNFAYQREYELQNLQKDSPKGNRIDFLIDDRIILDLKAKSFITKADYFQMQRYLKAANLPLGLIVNFRNSYLKPKRVLNSSYCDSNLGISDPGLRMHLSDTNKIKIDSDNSDVYSSHSDRSAGFTLIELILYLAIISGIAVAFTYYSISITNTRAKTYVVQEVHANARTALDIVSQKIRGSQGFTDPQVISDIGGNMTGTTGSLNATANILQRKTWYDGTRYWVAFWDGGTEIEFWYSPDGSPSSWVQNTFATIMIGTNDFSIEADGERAFVIYKNGLTITEARSAITDVTPYPGTGFSWSAPTAVFLCTSPCTSSVFVTLIRDTNGYLRAGAKETDGASFNNFYSVLSVNPNDITSWGPKGFPVFQSVSSGIILPLANGNMYAISNTLSGKKYTVGIGWGSGVVIASGSDPQAVSNPARGEIYLIYSASGAVHFKRYIDGSGWQASATVLNPGTNNLYSVISINSSNGGSELHAFWVQLNTIYHKKGVFSNSSNDFVWDASPDSLVLSGSNRYLSSAYSPGCNNIIPLIWTDTAPPIYEVKFYGKTTSFGCTSLVMADAAKNPTIFDIDANGVLRIKEGTGAPVAITSDEVKVTNFKLTNLTSTGARENIRIEMTVEYKNPSGDVHYNYSKSFQTTVSVRQ